MSERYIIYHDRNYPTSWIPPELSQRIVDYFSERGFVVKNAENLRDWMRENISGNPENSIVIFSQDIIPDTIIESLTVSNLINRYLDNGGRAIWFGDIPFYYRGRGDGSHETWTEIGLLRLLGVQSLRFSNYEVTIAERGTQLGLSTTWIGTRPVQIEPNMTILAGSIYGDTYTQINGWIFRNFIRLFDTNLNEDSNFLSLNHLNELYEVIRNIVTPPRLPDSLQLIETIFSRFHAVALSLQRRQRGRTPFLITDEYDLQDLLYALLKIHFDDIRREEYTPSYAGASSKIDWLLRNYNIAIEGKMTRINHTDAQIGAELLVDIARYQSHPHCNTLLCLVYDPEYLLTNPSGLISDLTRTRNGLNVRVHVSPIR